MSFADEIRKEILQKPIKESHCKIAFLSGIVRGNGILYERDGELGVDFRVPNEECVLTVTMLLKSLFNYDVREVSVSENTLSKKDKFIISLFGKGAVNIFKTLGIIDDKDGDLQVDFHLYNKVTQKECCLKAFIRGLFLATGNCTLPKQGIKHNNTGYHLELVFAHSSPAQATSNKLAKFGIYPKITTRKGNYILYLKSAEEIKDFIAFLPAPKSVLKITDLMINKELSNNSNRQKNCDLGNLNRQIEAVAKQVKAIGVLERLGLLDDLKPELKAVAIARKEYSSDTLNELSERLNLSKSCLNHRLRKLVSIANEKGREYNE